VDKRGGITVNYISMNWGCASYVRDTCACYTQQVADHGLCAVETVV
jgi:hypothetical protein